MPKKQPDRINIDQLAELFDLPSSERISDLNLDYVSDTGAAAYNSAIESGESENEAENAREKAELEVQDEVYGSWYNAVEHATIHLFELHALELTPGKKGGKFPYEFKIGPVKRWEDAADAIRETLNGVGYFHFNNLREFLDSGPFTARQAVLSHLHWIKSYPEVYGDRSARDLYERAWR